MKMTVREYMENELCSFGFRGDEYVRAVQFSITGITRDNFPSRTIEKKDGTKMLIKDCWETDSDDYIKEHLNYLYGKMQPYILEWCLNVIHSLK